MKNCPAKTGLFEIIESCSHLFRAVHFYEQLIKVCKNNKKCKYIKLKEL